jgi:hypothetical protein
MIQRQIHELGKGDPLLWRGGNTLGNDITQVRIAVGDRQGLISHVTRSYGLILIIRIDRRVGLQH